MSLGSGRKNAQASSVWADAVPSWDLPNSGENCSQVQLRGPSSEAHSTVRGARREGTQAGGPGFQPSMGFAKAMVELGLEPSWAGL